MEEFPASKVRKAAVVLRGKKDGPWRFDLDNPREIEKVLGRNLLLAFMKCFVGVDRLASLRSLYVLNHERKEGRDSHVGQREKWLLLLLIVGTLHELGEALQKLEAALKRSGKRDVPSWTKLTRIRRQWNQDPVVRAVRNQLAHHLGDDEVYRRGLDAVAGQPTLQLYLCDSPMGGQGTFEGAWNTVMLGLGLKAEDYPLLFAKMAADAVELEGVMASLFQEVVKLTGIVVADERSQ